ncbi:MAG: YkgJ family cysteine cluster protein [Victivallaceae bacterium]|nr:YkgJ family cysteine cluster protein [Victivallaceae bacterium]
MSNVSFNCRRCGNCCKWPGYVRLFSFEAEAIAEFLGITVHDFTDRYTVLTRDRRNLSLIECQDGTCLFLRDTLPPSCAIEAVKPRQCKQFPLAWNFAGWEKECAGTIFDKLLEKDGELN